MVLVDTNLLMTYSPARWCRRMKILERIETSSSKMKTPINRLLYLDQWSHFFKIRNRPINFGKNKSIFKCFTFGRPNDKIIDTSSLQCITYHASICDDNLTYSIGATSGSFQPSEHNKVAVNLIFIYIYLIWTELHEGKKELIGTMNWTH